MTVQGSLKSKSKLSRHESVNTRGGTVLRLQVQTSLEVNFLLNLFCPSLRSNTKKPDLPTLCKYATNEKVRTDKRESTPSQIGIVMEH